MTKILILILGLAWFIQIILGYLQIRRFNQAYTDLAKKGTYLGIGKSSGRFKPKVIVILALDANYCVVDSILMQGLSVFASPCKLEKVHGLHYQDTEIENIFPIKTRHYEALKMALHIKDTE